MDHLFGFYDGAAHAAGGEGACARPLSEAFGVAFETTGPGGARGGAVVIDGASRTSRTASTVSTQDGGLTISLLGPDASQPDAAERAARMLERHTGGSTAGILQDRLADVSEALHETLGDGFLCAIRDHRDDTLAVLRSRDCPRQLYYAEDRGRLWFGSHLPSLRRLVSLPAGIDGSAVAFFLAFGFPPRDRTFFESLKRLPSGAMLTAGPDACRIARFAVPPTPSAPGAADPLSILRAAVVADVAVAVAGRTVGVLGAPDDPRTAWLADAALQAGAARVVEIAVSDAPSLTERLRQVERLAETEGETFATPALSFLMAAADGAAGTVDLCLSPEGATMLAAGAARHARFAERIAERWGGRASRNARSQAFHDDRAFVRDHYFDELAIFDDAARLAMAGPALAQWNVFAMADELGPDLETATGEKAADLAGALDATFLAAGAIRPLVGAVSRVCGVPIRAPFASSTVLACARSMSSADRGVLGSMTAHWPKEDVADTIGIDRPGTPDGQAPDLLRVPGFAARGMVGRAALDRMLEDGARGEPKTAARLWALCCLETWFRRAVDPTR